VYPQFLPYFIIIIIIINIIIIIISYFNFQGRLENKIKLLNLLYSPLYADCARTNRSNCCTDFTETSYPKICIKFFKLLSLRFHLFKALN
jgi:hypothetical protein